MIAFEKVRDGSFGSGDVVSLLTCDNTDAIIVGDTAVASRESSK
jgi:hypothetical protein